MAGPPPSWISPRCVISGVSALRPISSWIAISGLIACAATMAPRKLNSSRTAKRNERSVVHHFCKLAGDFHHNGATRSIIDRSANDAVFVEMNNTRRIDHRRTDFDTKCFYVLGTFRTNINEEFSIRRDLVFLFGGRRVVAFVSDDTMNVPPFANTKVPPAQATPFPECHRAVRCGSDHFPQSCER